MSRATLNFMPLIDLYLVQQNAIIESSNLVEGAEAKVESFLSSLQRPEIDLREMDRLMVEKSRLENLQTIHQENELALEATRLQIMELLLQFPHPLKIHLNNSKAKPQYLLWDNEDSTFSLVGF